MNLEGEQKRSIYNGAAIIRDVEGAQHIWEKFKMTTTRPSFISAPYWSPESKFWQMYHRFLHTCCYPWSPVFNMFWFTCLFVEYSILYLSQLNFIWQDEKHVTSADQIPLVLVPSSKLSVKILFLFSYPRQI